ncbi:MAG: hypothetical protein Q8L48_31780 [Archangium sp.]|nr:hypothetical protein [Archangium sp.]
MRIADLAALGISRFDFYDGAWLARGTRLVRGVWVSGKRPPSRELEWATVIAQVMPRAVIGLRSAAALHGLTESPDVLELLVPRGSWSRGRLPWPSRCFGVAPRFAELYLEERPLRGQCVLRLTSAVRSAVDLVRYRNRVGPDHASQVLRRWLELGGTAQVALECARALRVERAVKAALRGLGAA